MGYMTFADKWNAASGDVLVAATHFNAPGDGIQDELELRAGDALLDGVVSGLACSIDGTDVAIGSGRAYVQGKRYSGGASVSFTGRSSGSYQVYLDSADDEVPFKAKTSALSAGELLLCAVSWNGTALSGLDDSVKVLGVVPYDLVVALPGTAGTGVKAVIPVAHDLWVDGVRIALSNNGSGSGSTTVDVHLGADGAKGASIFTTQSRRPSLAYTTAAYTVATSGEPDGDRKPDAGEHLVVEVDEVAGTPGTDLTVIVKARLR